MAHLLDKPLSRERSGRTRTLFGQHQWCANEVRGATCKIWGPPMTGGERGVGEPPLEIKRVDSEEKREDSFFLFPDHTGLWGERTE
ncbi:hypothetical protein TNCV_3847751 [Trichonephila clavipes]|nr:hypothetical protein TNCV_3847751 [Trichonephila clavipes]